MSYILNYLKIFLEYSIEDKINYLFAFTFLLLERLIPVYREKILRKEFFSQDLAHKIFDTSMHYFVDIFVRIGASFYIVITLKSFFAPIHLERTIEFNNAFFLYLYIFITRDFLFYWIHYLFHRIPFLWWFHMYHHSPSKLDWFSGQRGDILEGFILETVTSLGMLFTTISNEQLLNVFIFSKFLEYFGHSNIKYSVKYWGKIINNNHAHWWHHSKKCHLKYGQNFGSFTLIWDRLFHTYYTENDYPVELGIASPADFPSNFLMRMLYPYMKIIKNKWS